uniref:FIG00512629: secreted protein n=2 Tax=Nonomuraea gerenzanensis TaxID=93944 RepID=A0A1M4E0V9_9ACTN|nr:FIG00512629: secreted protein [Nonomuraea gerenzanensis]
MVLLLGGIVVLVAVLGVLLGPERVPERHLDPDDTSLAGSRALAELLRDRGVTVDRVDSVEAAAAKAATGDRVLLITDTTFFDELSLARIAGDRLVVGDVFGLEALAPGVRVEPIGGRVRSREPECGLPAATAAGSAFLGGMALRGPAGSAACYPTGDGHALVRFPYANGVITVVGDGDFMTNQRLAEDGNAALALNLIGTGKPVTWLVRPQTPPPLDLPGERGQSMYDLMPDNIRWTVYMAIVAVAVAGFWRGRRLGPVVTEKLPVIVRAAETVEGRGRLYRARRARERAADALRAGTIDRLTPRLGLASGAGRQEIVSALAARTGQDAQQVGAALYGPPPADDAGLVALAGYLDFMERQISEL